MKITKFICICLIILSYRVPAANFCIGNNYEYDLITPSNVTPEVKIEYDDLDIMPGDSLVLSVSKIIDPAGLATFYWCTDNGIFTPYLGSNKYNEVVFIPSQKNTSQVANVWVVLGDGLGHISIDEVEFQLNNSLIPLLDQNLTGFGVDNAEVKFAKINGDILNAMYVDAAARFDLPESIDTANLKEPLTVELFNSSNKSLYIGCLPFKDVCPGRWYTRSVMKLHQEDDIQGYGDGKTGIFDPNNNATRGEFIAVVVRALLGSIPAASSAPFEDVNQADWNAGAIEYAKLKNWISGCNSAKTRYCPNDPINHAEAMKILALAFPRVNTYLVDCQANPATGFSDVDAAAWYAPFVCAAEAAQAAGGFAAGTLRPGQYMLRASMAKSVCVAAYGPAACIESGDDLPMVLAVTPTTANIGQAVTLSIEGFLLPVPVTLALPGCDNVSALSGGTAEQQQFTCTPSVAGILNGQVKDAAGTVLFEFPLSVQGVSNPDTGSDTTNTDTPTTDPGTEPDPATACTTPTVDTVSPDTVVMGALRTFTVTGSCLSDTTAFWIGECASDNVSSTGSIYPMSGGTATQRKYQCIPSYTPGVKDGVVKDAPSGNVLKNFTVDVQPCTPNVSSVSPLSANLNQLTTLTVSGSCLPDTTVLWVDGCMSDAAASTGSLSPLPGGNMTRLQFQCTPSYDAGVRSGVVKDKPGGTLLRDFTLTVQ